MINILANDGLDKSAIDRLTASGFAVTTIKISQENLASHIQNYDVVVVRSATKIRKQELEAASKLKLVVRGGVGVDNIDIAFAETKKISVRNTPLASSNSVAEMVFAHLFCCARFLYDSNREMYLNGELQFKELKTKYSKGIELRGKTLGIIGFGNIGIEVARIAYGLGMQVLAYDLRANTVEMKMDFPGNPPILISTSTIDKDFLLANSDFISVHVSGNYEVLNKSDFEKMKKGVGIINCSRGGVVNESDLIEFLNAGQIAFAGIDVFLNEPTPREDLLKHKRVSLSPHIAASTLEGQERIGNEVADIIINYFKK